MAIVDAEGAGDLLPYIREGATTVVNLHRAHLNAWVLARTLLSGRLSMLDYAAAYLRTVKPSVVLTMIDTTPFFYRLKARWPSATYIAVQNGWRCWEFSRDFPSTTGPYRADFILCFGEAAASLYRRHIDAEPLVVGSIRNNAAVVRIPEVRQRTVALISTLRDKVDLNDWMPGYGVKPVIQYREMFDRRLALASWIAEYCSGAGLHLRIVGKDLNSTRERSLYVDRLGPEGNGWSFAARQGPHSSYKEVSRARIVVSTGSTLGYEALATGVRTAFFHLEADLPGLEDYGFGWPFPFPDEGDIWLNRLDREGTHRIMERLDRISDEDWARRLSELIPRLIDHDPGNTRLRGLLNSLGVGRA